VPVAPEWRGAAEWRHDAVAGRSEGTRAAQPAIASGAASRASHLPAGSTVHLPRRTRLRVHAPIDASCAAAAHSSGGAAIARGAAAAADATFRLRISAVRQQLLQCAAVGWPDLRGIPYLLEKEVLHVDLHVEFLHTLLLLHVVPGSVLGVPTAASAAAAHSTTPERATGVAAATHAATDIAAATSVAAAAFAANVVCRLRGQRRRREC
jgi:hypothetical protein